MHNFLSHTDEIRHDMLKEIGLSSIDELFAQIDPKICFEKLNLSDGISEQEVQKKLSELAAKNTSKNISFLGGGVYNRYVPACIQNIAQRTEFITSYTPYQPEVSQGTLQAVFDYQTLICNLTGMDAANASVYDGASACAEAVLMAARLTRKTEVLVSEALNPESKAVLETYCYGEGLNISYLQGNENFDDYACVLAQNPNYFGELEPMALFEKVAESKAKLIVCIDPITPAVLKSPAEYGADIVVGDFQPLGLSMNFGGPHGGFVACKKAYLRQLPGRVVGLTTDKDGREAFTLTLQTREQHIRREKATSNICTNNALCALAATIYLSVLGTSGLREVANISIQRTHYMAEKLAWIQGISLISDKFLYEFVIKLEGITSEEFIKKLAHKGIFIGIDLSEKFKNMKNHILICVTEMNTPEDIDKTIKEIEELLR